MKTYIEFILVGRKTTTLVWGVRTTETQTHLGYVKWWSPWRRYAFFPDNATLYEETCLTQIATFVQNETDKHKAAPK